MKTLSNVLKSDISDIVNNVCIPWQEMQNKAIFITGATGLIGSMLIRTLSAANVEHDLNIRIIIHGRTNKKTEALARENGAEYIISDIREPISTASLLQTIDYIFHCAAITNSATMVANPVDVITTAVNGTNNTLKLAAERNCKSYVYLSSMEVYGYTELQEVNESNLGYLDLTNPRSSYPVSKRGCEALCAAYNSQYNVPVKIARPAQTFGAGTPKDDTRVFAQFARSALSGSDIELHTEGNSRGNYCYTADAISGLLTILLKGKNNETYNIANTSATIREMAELVAKDICDGKIKTVVNIPKDISKRGYAPAAGHTLNTDKLKTLGWKPKYELDDMYKRMLDDWKENTGNL